MNYTSDPTFWISIGSMVIGGILLITGVITAALYTQKEWWMWTLIIIGTLLALIGSGMMIWLFSESHPEDGKWVQVMVNGCPQMVWEPCQLPQPSYQPPSYQPPPPPTQCGCQKPEQYTVNPYYRVNQVQEQQRPMEYTQTTTTTYQRPQNNQPMQLEKYNQ